MLKSIFFLSILALLSCSNAPEKEDSFSENNIQENYIDIEVASKFLNQYANRDFSIDMEKWVKDSEMTTENFQKALRKLMEEAWQENPELGLGFDPIINGQDTPDDGYDLENYDPLTGYAIVSPNGWEETKIPVKLVNVNGKTLVDGCGIVNIPEDMQFD